MKRVVKGVISMNTHVIHLAVHQGIRAGEEARGIGARVTLIVVVGAVIPIKIGALTAQALFAPPTLSPALRGQQKMRRLRGQPA